MAFNRYYGDIMAIRFCYKESKIEIFFNYEFISNEDFMFEGHRLRDDRGRRVAIVLIFINGEQIAEGVSVCRPPDNFNKSIGRKIAIKDALYKIENKNLRKAIWNNYRKTCK